MSFESRVDEFLKLGFRESALPKLREYIDLLWSSNEELNLVSRKMTFNELIDNHIIDSLLPLAKFPKDLKKVADFGSGSGMPAVLFALQFPETEFQLFEKSNLKREFLASCQKSIAPNLKLEGQILLSFGNVELVTARAFKPIDVILDMSRNYYAGGGKYFLLKGRREKIEGEISLAKKKFTKLQCQIEILKSPVLEVERHLVLI